MGLFSALVGAVAPVSVNGRTYLRQCIKQKGIDPNDLPNNFIEEVFQISEELAEFGVGPSFKVRLVDKIEGNAHLINHYLRNPIELKRNLERDFVEPIAALVHKYGIVR
jgi:hypothetical protein